MLPESSPAGRSKKRKGLGVAFGLMAMSMMNFCFTGEV